MNAYTPETLDYDSNGIANSARSYLAGDIATQATLIRLQEEIDRERGE
jgi:hypothetical protein